MAIVNGDARRQAIRDTHDQFMQGLVKRNPGEPEFHQAVEEVAESLIPFLLDHPEYTRAQILERMTEPDRAIIFRVTWMDDQGEVHANRGYRVQFNNAIGPYKGGLRFHHSVTLSILKFLGFEQTFKNSLTTLPMGGAKGGANFNPKGKSDAEVMRFCQSFMTQLWRYIGKDMDVPAGDIGVGAREISYLFGQYKRLTGEFTGALTGKGPAFGGSLIRTEATGYGCVYFVQEMLTRVGESMEGKTCVVSGAGNVAQYTVEKALELGAKVVTVSDSTGTLHCADGFRDEDLAEIKRLKNVVRGSLAEIAETNSMVRFLPGQRPWHVPCDVAFPCATQNEIELEDARALVGNGVRVIGEGANMPSTRDAMHAFLESKVLFAPSKAANAGGVAVSGLEQTQNAMRLQWTRDEVDAKLKDIMRQVHHQCVAYGQEGDYVNYVDGANIAGFLKVADAMLACGLV